MNYPPPPPSQFALLPSPTAPNTHTSYTLLLPVTRRRGRETEPPARPRNVGCGRNICHKILTLLIWRGGWGRDKTREESEKERRSRRSTKRERGKRIQRKRTEGRKLSGRKKKEKKNVSLVICRAAWQKVQQGQQDQSFKCCLVLAELCVSALCGSTKSWRPAKHGDSHTTSRAHQNPFTQLALIFPISLQLSHGCTAVPWGMHFKIMSWLPHFFWFMGL